MSVDLYGFKVTLVGCINFIFVVKLIGLEVVHDDCKTIVMTILDELCEDIFVSCDPENTRKKIG